MLVIRLQRTGRKNLPTYRIVAAEKSAPPKGKFIEILGYYLANVDPPKLAFQAERVQTLVKQGAIPSDTVARILSRNGLPELAKFIIPYAKKAKKGKEEGKAPPEATKEEGPAMAASAKAEQETA